MSIETYFRKVLKLFTFIVARHKINKNFYLKNPQWLSINFLDLTTDCWINSNNIKDTVGLSRASLGAYSDVYKSARRSLGHLRGNYIFAKTFITNNPSHPSHHSSIYYANIVSEYESLGRDFTQYSEQKKYWNEINDNIEIVTFNVSPVFGLKEIDVKSFFETTPKKISFA